eukprot:m.750737 g.750737  ORF g.750737 m.750737 type:complete len:324 (+) comp58982_c0_seq10:1884-2855(+)
MLALSIDVCLLEDLDIRPHRLDEGLDLLVGAWFLRTKLVAWEGKSHQPSSSIDLGKIRQTRIARLREATLRGHIRDHQNLPAILAEGHTVVVNISGREVVDGGVCACKSGKHQDQHTAASHSRLHAIRKNERSKENQTKKNAVQILDALVQARRRTAEQLIVQLAKGVFHVVDPVLEVLQFTLHLARARCRPVDRAQHLVGIGRAGGLHGQLVQLPLQRLQLLSKHLDVCLVSLDFQEPTPLQCFVLSFHALNALQQLPCPAIQPERHQSLKKSSASEKLRACVDQKHRSSWLSRWKSFSSRILLSCSSSWMHCSRYMSAKES